MKHIKWKLIQTFFVPNLHRCLTKAEEMEINIVIYYLYYYSSSVDCF